MEVILLIYVFVIRTRSLTIVAIIITVILAVAVATPLVLWAHHMRVYNDKVVSNEYPSRYTGILKYPNKYCNRLTLQGSGNSGKVRSTLYLLNSEVVHTKKEEILVNNTYNLIDGYVSWDYYLLPNSTIVLKGCTVSSSSSMYYLLQGRKNFIGWENTRQADYLLQSSIKICSDNKEEMSPLPSYTVRSEDLYYIIIAGANETQLQADITQILYAASDHSVDRQCSINLDAKDSCSLPVDLSSSYSEALLEVEPTGTKDLQEYNKIIVKCSPRDWLFAITGILIVIGVVLLVISVVGISLHCYRRGWCSRGRTLKSVNINSPILNDSESSQYYQSL